MALNHEILRWPVRQSFCPVTGFSDPGCEHHIKRYPLRTTAAFAIPVFGAVWNRM